MKLFNLKKRYPNQLNPEREKSINMATLLSGKNVLITGAGRNIGRSIALEMAQQGANIFFTDIDYERCEKLKKELSDYPIASKEFISDISKHEDINTLYNSILEAQIKIDILVNNAGIQTDIKSGKKNDSKKLQKLFETNLFGPIHLTKLISQMMIENNISGSILFITSLHQWMVSLDEFYSASKAALGMIIKELAIELAPHNIRVNGIAPGNIKEDEKGNTIPHRYTPLYGSSINPCYIGRAAVYLSSDYYSRYTTGTVIKIDGGLSLYNHLVDKSKEKY
jgi:NAD(P)-dependent dehydrogenase (short-subunit alcohol dehydrogenase family)